MGFKKIFQEEIERRQIGEKRKYWSCWNVTRSLATTPLLGRVSVATDETQKEKAKTVEHAGLQHSFTKKEDHRVASL